MNNSNDQSVIIKKKNVNGIHTKKPILSKAERRAIQEAQRVNKGKSPTGVTIPRVSKSCVKKDDINISGQLLPTHTMGNSSLNDEDEYTTLRLFSHLPHFKDVNKLKIDPSGISLETSYLHPAVLLLGQQYASGGIRGANARCKAMLRTFQNLVMNYCYSKSSSFETNDLRQDIELRILKPSFQYWTSECRIHSVTMGNAYSFVKLAIANLPRDVTIDLMKESLVETMEAYIRERIYFADRAISKYASTKIVNNDVILTFSKSDVIEYLLLQASAITSFRVICVDARPMLEGRQMMENLAKMGIECTYILLNAVSYVIGDVTKVLLGSAALFSDGSVLSRVGTACVALLAKSNHIPVLVCCESYKISHRVQLESITWNELGNPEDLMDYAVTDQYEVFKDYRHCPRLKWLNLLYDLTPSTFVSGIITEMGILPPTSIAVLLREMNPQKQPQDGF